jgi:hypothetical protein
MQASLYKEFQSSNPEKFNEDVIFMRKNEDIHSYFKDLYTTLNLPGIKFLGSRTITDETTYSQYVQKNNLRIEDNRLDLIEAKFKLTHDNESKTVTLYVFFPKLIDNFFFHLNGNKFFAIYQLTDRNFYSVRKGLFLKTLLMPLGLKFESLSSIKGYSNAKLNGKIYKLEFFKTKMNKDKSLKNALLYLYVKFGFEETLEMLGMNSDYIFFSEAPLKENSIPKGFIHFSKNSGCNIYYNKVLTETADSLNILCTIIHSLDDTKKFSSVTSDVYWKKKILNTPTAKIEKADKALFSLERILDERTKKNLRELEDHEKNSIYDVIIYMMYNFTKLYELDNVDIYNRRIRLYEYLLFPLLTKFSDLSYRMLNSRNMDLDRLSTVFSNIGSMFVIKHLVKNELIRYSSCTNALELFSVALKFSARGPQSLGNSSGNTPIKFRGLHESYIGNISLNNSSASDPGCTGTIIPFCKNLDNMFFEKENE